MHGANAQRTLKILQAINNSEVVQAAMAELSDALLRLLSSIALDSSIFQCAVPHPGGVRVFGSFNAAHYDKALVRLLQRATTSSAQDSGSVHVIHVLEALAKGNVRERCTIFMNIIFKDPEALVMHWILYRAVEYSPFFLNMCVVYEYKARVYEDEHQCMHLYRNRLQRREPCEQQRLMRTREDREKRRLRPNAIVPVLSHREAEVVRVEKDGKLSWLTGNMKWYLNKVPARLIKAHKNDNEIMCGISGHTDLLLTFARVFTCYDLRVFTLIAVLWLVGCEHHSPCEVLLAARAHGLPYEGEDALLYIEMLLASL